VVNILLKLCLFSNSSSQVEMVTLDQLVLSDHIYCKFKDLWDLSIIESELEEIEINSDHKGFGIFRLFISLLLGLTQKPIP